MFFVKSKLKNIIYTLLERRDSNIKPSNLRLYEQIIVNFAKKKIIYLYMNLKFQPSHSNSKPRNDKEKKQINKSSEDP